MHLLLKISIYTALWLLPFTISAQVMHPGDANNNGIVNAVDVLYIGLAYDAVGPERMGATTDFTPQPFELWPQSFPNGLNYGYADADGDGEIEDDDIEFGITANFGLTHGVQTPDGYQNASAGSGAPVATLSPSATLVEPGATVDISLSLGNMSQPIENFYGVAFVFSFDGELLEPTSPGITYDDLDNPWFDINGDEAEDLFVTDVPNNRAELALTRTNQSPVSGNGEVAQFSIFIEDIIVGLEVDTFTLSIDSILLIDHTFKTTAIVPDAVDIIIAADTNLVQANKPISSLPVRVYPNPAQEQIWIESPQPLSQVELLDAQGGVIHRQGPIPAGQQLRLPLQGLPSGLYLLRGWYGQQSFVRKIVVY
jgi:hypothetical protein